MILSAGNPALTKLLLLLVIFDIISHLPWQTCFAASKPSLEANYLHLILLEFDWLAKHKNMPSPRDYVSGPLLTFRGDLETEYRSRIELIRPYGIDCILFGMHSIVLAMSYQYMAKGRGSPSGVSTMFL